MDTVDSEDDIVAYEDSDAYLATVSNDAPVLSTIADISVNEGETVSFSPTATDSDGDTLTFSYTGWMTSSSYTTDDTDAGTHTVTVTVSDGTLTDSQDVTVTVLDVTVNNDNQAPVLAEILDITVNEGADVTFNPTATDADGDTLTYSYTGWMTSSSYTTDYTDGGSYAVTVTVTDEDGLSDTQNVTVSVISTDVSYVTVSWDENTESDLDGYKVYYGTSVGTYVLYSDVGNVTSKTLSSLDSGETYYIVVTAYDTSDNESDYSDHVTHSVPVY